MAPCKGLGSENITFSTVDHKSKLFRTHKIMHFSYTSQLYENKMHTKKLLPVFRWSDVSLLLEDHA